MSKKKNETFQDIWKNSEIVQESFKDAKKLLRPRELQSRMIILFGRITCTDPHYLIDCYYEKTGYRSFKLKYLIPRNFHYLAGFEKL